MIPQPCLAVIINSERLKKEDDKAKGSKDTKAAFYMKQSGTLDNACGIIACVHGILNNLSAEKITLIDGKTLSNFHTACLEKSPEERAAYMETFTEFQQIHATFASQGGSAMATTQAEVKHHFTAFVVNADGHLIELDGTKQGPHVIKEACGDLLKDTVAEIQKRLADGEISESLSMMTLNAK